MQPQRSLRPAPEAVPADIDSIVNDTSTQVNSIVVPSTGLVITPVEPNAAANAAATAGTAGPSSSTSKTAPVDSRGPGISTTTTGAPYIVPRGTDSSGSVITPGLPQQ